MHSIEEIHNIQYYDKDSYFTSSINVKSRSKRPNSAIDNTTPTATNNNSSFKSNKSSSSNSGNQRKRLATGAYNLNALENQIHGTAPTEETAEYKSSMKRFQELDRENYNDARFDLPKTIHFQYNKYPASKDRVKPKVKGNAYTQLRKVLNSRRSLANHMDELDDATRSVILSYIVTKPSRDSVVVMKKKLCSICGDSSPSSCVYCGLRVCSVKCSNVHKETRCSNYYSV